MTEHEVDVVVLGLSPGGEDAASRLAEAGLAVAGVEKRLVGGECPYFGCVPSKMMIRAGNLLAEARRVAGMSGTAAVTADWAPVARRIREEATDTWDDTVAADRFIGKGGQLFRGHGRITAPGEVTVGGAVLRARRGIIIAIGTDPAIPPVPGLAGTPYWTNREAIETEQVPESLIVLGGGSVGTELAQAFAAFGARVTIIEQHQRLLPAHEPEAGELVAGVFRRAGIVVLAGTRPTQVRHDGSCFTVWLDDGSQVSGARLLVAAGRRADLAGAGVAAAGLDEKAAVIAVDGHLRAAPGVWALGDVTGQGAFTHMSMYHAQIIVADVLGRDHHPAELHAVPWVTFTDPEIGAVGSTEATARMQGIAVRTAIAQLPQSARGWIHKAGNDGFIKLVADSGRGVLVGATSAGPAGGEVLSMLTLAVHARVPVSRLNEMIYAYPTFHGAVQDALRGLG
jgi:pyruvate/2-oxoglutarate dehydrogenase complex dihydrolipoamide dehydrogenase (E3) component